MANSNLAVSDPSVVVELAGCILAGIVVLAASLYAATLDVAVPTQVFVLQLGGAMAAIIAAVAAAYAGTKLLARSPRQPALRPRESHTNAA